MPKNKFKAVFAHIFIRCATSMHELFYQTFDTQRKKRERRIEEDWERERYCSQLSDKMIVDCAKIDV